MHAVVWGGSSCDDGLAVVQRDQVQGLLGLDPTTQQHTRHETACRLQCELHLYLPLPRFPPCPPAAEMESFFSRPLSPPSPKSGVSAAPAPAHQQRPLWPPVPHSGVPPAPVPAQQRQESETETSLPPPHFPPHFQVSLQFLPLPSSGKLFDMAVFWEPLLKASRPEVTQADSSQASDLTADYAFLEEYSKKEVSCLFDEGCFGVGVVVGEGGRKQGSRDCR